MLKEGFSTVVAGRALWKSQSCPSLTAMIALAGQALHRYESRCPTLDVRG